ncbi:MAG: DUF1553 domain-containing protein, partial [Verrucomicrobiota bacterium]
DRLDRAGTRQFVSVEGHAATCADIQHQAIGRGLIVYRRAAPYPSMVNFDAPDRGICTVQRARTNTPLQALTLMNDPAYVEMAYAFGDRIASASDDNAERFDFAFHAAFARRPTAAELSHLNQIYLERVTAFRSDPEAAKQLIDGVRGYHQAKHQDNAELAAWFYVATVLFNLDEMITKP